MVDHTAPYPNELRTCIKLAGFSVRSVSKQTTIPESTLHDWAAGNRVIPHKERQTLASLLSCDVKRLAPQITSASLPQTPLAGEARDLPSESECTLPTAEKSSPFSQSVPQDTIAVSVSNSGDQIGASGLPATDSASKQQSTPVGIQQECMDFSLSPEEVELLSSLIRGESTMLFDPSKRDALQRIAALALAAFGSSTTGPFAISDPEPWERLIMAQGASSPSTFLSDATLAYFEDLLRISWQLCDGNQLAPAEGVLVGFLPHLLSLPKQEPGTASLTSRGLHLQSIFAGHHLRLSDKVRLCEQSVNYAVFAQDANTLVTASVELSVAYDYARQPDSLQKRLLILQKALCHSSQASPLVQSSLYSEYSLVLAESGRIREAELYIGLALEVFPDDPRSDPAFALAGGSIFNLPYCAGFVCIHAGRIPQAFSAFERYKQHSSGLVIPERMRLEIANGQSQAAILDNDAERYAHLLEDVLVGSLHLRSKKRFDEALRIFQEDMPASWLSVDRIRQLAEQYGLKRAEERRRHDGI